MQSSSKSSSVSPAGVLSLAARGMPIHSMKYRLKLSDLGIVLLFQPHLFFKSPTSRLRRLNVSLFT
jgi:hypothetical protein